MLHWYKPRNEFSLPPSNVGGVVYGVYYTDTAIDPLEFDRLNLIDLGEMTRESMLESIGIVNRGPEKVYEKIV